MSSCFYISSVGHSASGWLSKALNKHPNIISFHAIRSLPPIGIDERKNIPKNLEYLNLDKVTGYEKSNAEEFNRMLIEDANDKSKWKLKSIIGYKPNRLLSYPCNYFHSKYPNKFKEPRKVLVIFYK